tara:strand:+ start:1943 stop:2188 length:246 start_codon:yes stop_codon:yes gene_type:complete
LRSNGILGPLALFRFLASKNVSSLFVLEKCATSTGSEYGRRLLVVVVVVVVVVLIIVGRAKVASAASSSACADASSVAAAL